MTGTGGLNLRRALLMRTMMVILMPHDGAPRSLLVGKQWGDMAKTLERLANLKLPPQHRARLSLW
jgi:hypothetical protein